jgi:membrane protein
VLLLGAEINSVIEHKSPDGKAAGAKSMAEKGVTGTKSEVEEKGGELPGPKPLTAASKAAARGHGRPRPRGEGVAAALRRSLVGVAVGAAYLFGRRRGQRLA